MQKNSTLYVFLRALYILLSLVFPLGLLLIVGFTPAATYFSYGSWLDTAAYYCFWFYAMPVQIIYGGIAAIRFFPTKVRDVAILFFPIVVGLGTSLWIDGIDHFLASSIVHATTFYVGLYAILVIGLLPLMITMYSTMTRGESWQKKVGELIARLFVFSLLFVPLLLTLVYAHNVGRGALESISDGSPWRVWLYYAQTVFVAASFWPRLVQLYKEGKL